MKWMMMGLIFGVGCINPVEWRKQHCHYDGAYSLGMNEARSGQAMDSQQFIGQCPVEIEAEVMDGYREGYNSGLRAPPLPSNSSSRHRSAPAHEATESYGAQSTCSSSLDCKPGFCKDRGDGIHVCMSKGQRGDYCSNSTDCGSGLFCKDGPQGLKVCR